MENPELTARLRQDAAADDFYGTRRESQLFSTDMKRTTYLLYTCAALSHAIAASTGFTQDNEIPAGQLFERMGDWTREFSTESEPAEEFLTQGFIWLQSFNHDEAIRCFNEALKLDSNLAIAHWGISFAEGPNYNDPAMDERRNNAAWAALQNARDKIEFASEWERDLIQALSARYADPAPEDRTALNEAFAVETEKLWEKYPNDPHIGALYAESLMTLRPWALYNSDREPVGDTDHIVATLEEVLEMAPNHPGACHLYIHAVEQSQTPERALAIADRLTSLVPASGHMLHMPSHIYTRVNAWDLSIKQNALAMQADDRYREKSKDHKIQHMYMVHNNHILAYSAMMVGRKQEALDAARKMWTDLPEDVLPDIAPMIDPWMCSVYDVEKRFGLWDALLEEPAPPEFMPLTTAYWRAHRAIAFAAKKDFDAALEEYAAFETIYNTPPDPATLFPGWTQQMFQKRLDAIRHFVPGEIALQRGEYDLASMHLERAVAAEDELGFGGEPPEYLQPIRHTLGAVYFKAERYEDAENVYLRDLDEFPGNGWSLYGLSRALEAQGKTEEAERAERDFRVSWAQADEPLLTTSCKCIEEL